MENAYALALIYIHQKDYKKVRKLLKPFVLSSKKAKQLFVDSIVYEFYYLLHFHKIDKALALRDKYIDRYPKLRSLKVDGILLQDGYKAYNKKDFKKALRIFTRLYKKEKNFENSYAMALISLEYGKFQKVREYLEPFKSSNKKARDLYFDSIVTQYYIYLKFKKNKEALALQKRYINEFPKLKSLAKPEPKYTLAKGYKAYKQKQYKKALQIFSHLYKNNKNFENSYAMALASYQLGNDEATRKYLEYYRFSNQQASDLYYNSIIRTYYKYYNNHQYRKAIYFLKKYKKFYPKLQNFHEALLKLADSYIQNGAFDEAENLLKANGFAQAKKYIFNGKYKKAIALRKQKKGAKGAVLLTPYVPYYSKASTFFGEVSCELASKHMANNEFLQAKNLLLPILSKSLQIQQLYQRILYEENIYKGWKAYNNKEMQKAIKYFENGCKLSYEESCLVGIMHTRYQLKEYKKALIVAKKAYVDFNAQDASYIAYESAKALGDKKRMQFWLQKLPYKYQKIVLYETKVTEKNFEALNKRYLILRQKHMDDFDLVENYLYFLKNAHKYKLFEKTFDEVKAIFTSEIEQFRLKEILREYHNETLYRYFQEKKYEQCFEYGNEVLFEGEEAQYKRLHAWCAFKARRYDKATKLFDKIIQKYGSDAEDRYGRFLSAFEAHNLKDAKKYLQAMKKHHDNLKRLAVINFYIAEGMIQKAQKIVQDMEDGKQKIKLQKRINGSYKYDHNKINSVSGGVYYKERNVADKLHSFLEYDIPLDVDIYETKFHYDIHFDILHLYDDFAGSKERYSMEYGLGWMYDKDKTFSKTTLVPNAKIEYKDFSFQVGTSPLGGEIQPALLTDIGYHYYIDELFYTHIELSRSMVDDSMLSLIGLDISRDGKSGAWGRVVKNGINVGIYNSNHYFYSLNIEYYPLIDGQNVMKNSEIKGVGTFGYSVPTNHFAYLDLSVMSIIDSYDKNTDLFTYGHGGYFSPQSFFMIGTILEAGKNMTSWLYWRIKAMVGYENFRIDDVEKYPILDDKTQGLSGEIQGYKESGTIYKIAFGSGMKINRDFDVVGAISYEKMKEFDTMAFGFSLIYSFDKKKKRVNMYSIHTEDKIDSLLK
ncbi:Cellulose synthase operon protein C [hydrothermal vent metagenome]|uniref:Cellulose synthase operon protein C n=1 Tax=hydrothermal vent metagenome TaxID=652676 RepID=A0A1W1D514_9ZZZZ